MSEKCLLHHIKPFSSTQVQPVVNFANAILRCNDHLGVIFSELLLKCMVAPYPQKLVARAVPGRGTGGGVKFTANKNSIPNYSDITPGDQSK